MVLVHVEDMSRKVVTKHARVDRKKTYIFVWLICELDQHLEVCRGGRLDHNTVFVLARAYLGDVGRAVVAGRADTSVEEVGERGL